MFGWLFKKKKEDSLTLYEQNVEKSLSQKAQDDITSSKLVNKTVKKFGQMDKDRKPRRGRGPDKKPRKHKVSKETSLDITEIK